MIRIFSKNLWNSNAGRFQPGYLEILNSKISQIDFTEPKGVHAKKKTLDFDSLFIGPSAIDLHTHARDFEESHKETFESFEQAAMKGGVSVAACMANTWPRMDSVKKVKDFLKIVGPRAVKFVPFAAVTENLEGTQPTDWASLLAMPIAGLSDDGKPVLDEKILRAALVAAKKKQKLISLHEEDTRISKASVLHFSETSLRLGVEGSSDEAEYSLVERDLKIAAEAKAHLHLGHISSARSVHLIRKAKRMGQSVSAELTPHHGLLSVDAAEKLSIDRLSLFKVCPPIRSADDRAALRKAIMDESLDCFASDHAPHSNFEKDLPIDQAAHGIIGLEYFFPLYNELRLQCGFSWRTFYSCMSTRPAQLLPHLKGVGGFQSGYEASFIVFDPLLVETLHWSRSKSKNSPFEGTKIRGKVFQHWISGKKVYDALKF